MGKENGGFLEEMANGAIEGTHRVADATTLIGAGVLGAGIFFAPLIGPGLGILLGGIGANAIADSFDNN